MEPQKLQDTKKDNLFVKQTEVIKNLQSYDYDKNMDNTTEDEYDIVNRRGPINPLRTIKNLRTKTKGQKQVNKIKNDPRLKNNPLRGRLVVCISTTVAILFIFFAEMVFNKTTFGGRCLSKVLYTKELGQKPAFIPITHGSCEYNLETKAASRVFFGPSDADKGWPITVKSGNETETTWHFPIQTSASNIQTNTLTAFGGLDTNIIRNYGENFRLFWSTFMHNGFGHIAFNLLSQLQLLWIIEPDWGFIRTLLLFFISGAGSGLTSSTLDPCHITVGSSGALYGLYGAMIPYIIEYWNTLPYPIFLIIFLLISLVIGVLFGLSSNIDNYAHLGGCVFGLLWGLTSIRSVSIFDRWTIYEVIMLSPLFSWMTTKNYKEDLKLRLQLKRNPTLQPAKKSINSKYDFETNKKRMRINKIITRFSNHGSPPFRNRLREWVVRIVSALILVRAT
ncbi:hypothetical protein MACK_001312 [Theileria orientalis]|uniref:Rhomboid-like protease n=1 Tax=Theileria orientalis TaxID=68886 RepID=A0A976MCL3_THEOR|nr:hypothetical protein MACK_001312 [Theileria orientalis]